LTVERQPSFTILWQHDGVRQLDVFVDADLPPYGPMEKRIRGIASIASSHGGLRRLLENAYASEWAVSVFETVGGVTTVRLVLLARSKDRSRSVLPPEEAGKASP
jgi:hypothetical protein